MSIEKKLKIAIESGNKDKIRDVFEQIFINYKNLVAFVVSKYIESNEDVNDLIYDVFLDFFNNAEKIDKNIKSYLSMMAKNKALNFLNKQRKIENFDINILDIINNDDYYKETHNFNLIINDLHRFLSKNEIDIILDHLIEGLSFKEIALKNNLNENNVKSKYFRALKKCNKEMKGDK